MIDLNKVIKMLSKDEIQTIIKLLEEELEARQRKESFDFYFTASNVPRKYHPYVARLHWVNGRIQRQFYNFKRSYHKDGTVSVYGHYEALPGSVLEMRFNEYDRQWFIVLPNGKLKEFGFYTDEEGKKIMTEYLKGNLSLEEVEAKVDEKELDKLFKE